MSACEIARIRTERQKIIDEYGPWTAHNIHLGNGIYTAPEKGAGAHPRVAAALQIVSGSLARPIEGARVLDLACLEGAFSIEFGLRGAHVLGVEGRRSNVEKAIFARDVLRLRTVNFVKDDVRNISLDRNGKFDIVLCLGILYHLNAKALFPFLKNIAEMTAGIAIIETTCAAERLEFFDDGLRYYGHSIREHGEETNTTTRERRRWSSLDNQYSFWLTRPSLLNMLLRSGFRMLFECLHPGLPAARNRVLLVAANCAETVPLYASFPNNQTALFEEDDQRPINIGNRDNPETTPLSLV